jgi:hypothetical protein
MIVSIRTAPRLSKLANERQTPPGVTAAVSLRLPKPYGSMSQVTSGPTAYVWIFVFASNWPAIPSSVIGG